MSKPDILTEINRLRNIEDLLRMEAKEKLEQLKITIKKRKRLEKLLSSSNN